MRKRLVALVLLLSTLGLSLGRTSPAHAQSPDAGLTLRVTAGWDGYYKDRRWFPVWVDLSNSGPSVEAAVVVEAGADYDGNARLYRMPVSLPTQSHKALTVYVYGDSYLSQVNVRLFGDRDRELIAPVVSNNLTQLNSDDLLYAIVSPERPPLGFLTEVTGRRGQAAVAYLDVATLPEQAAAWNSFDVLIVANADTTRLTPLQRHWLSAWLATGGQLIVTGGPGAALATAGLVDWLPVRLEGNQALPDLPALRAVLEAATGATLPFATPGPYLVATSRLQQGEVWWQQDEWPLLARRAWGNGAVYFLALDPALAPLSGWTGNPALWSQIAARIPAPHWLANGFVDPPAARLAIESLDALALPSVAYIVLFVVVYIVVIGPLNYLVLRARGRREWAWLSVPLLSLLFLLVAYGVGFRLKGRTLLLNQMSVGYGSAETGAVRLTTVVGLYSPRRARYTLDLPADTLPHAPLPGLDNNADFQLWQGDGRQTVAGLRVDVGAVAPFIVDSYSSGLLIEGGAVYRLDGDQLQLVVTLHNRSAQPLTDVAVLIGQQAMRLAPTLAPGQSISRSLLVTNVAAANLSAGPTRAPVASGWLPTTTLIGDGDPAVQAAAFARQQLLLAVAGGSAYLSVPVLATGKSEEWFSAEPFTLVAWSSQPVHTITVADHEQQDVAAAVYFLTLPVTPAPELVGTQLELGWPLLDWRLIDNNIGLFEANLTDLYLTQGWVDVAFQPWPPFQNTQIDRLSIVLEPGPDSVAQTPPQLQLWNWGARAWDTVDGITWGTNSIAAVATYLGDGHTVRLRLENRSATPLTIHRFNPVLSGLLPAAPPVP